MLDDGEFYFEWVRHEDQMFADRGNFFLVAQGTVLAGHAALLSSTPVNETALKVLFAAGLLIAATWIWVNLFHIFVTQRRLKAKWRECDARAKGITAHRLKFVGAHTALGIFLPVTLAVLLLLLYFSGP